MKALPFLSSAAAFALMGCAGVPASSAGGLTWRLEHFTVSFTAGEGSQSREGRPVPGSFYQITPLRTGASGRITAASWQSPKSIRSEAEARRWIRITEDPETESLVIHEDIPNDNSACSNYVWIRPSGDGAFSYSYLQLPERGYGNPNAADSEFPEILSLRDGMLTYRYPHGGKASVKIGTLPQKKEPQQPG